MKVGVMAESHSMRKPYMARSMMIQEVMMILSKAVKTLMLQPKR